MKYSIKLKSKKIVNTELIFNESSIQNDWKHELILTPICDPQSEKDNESVLESDEETDTDTDSDTDTEVIESEEIILEIDEFSNSCYIIYGFYCNTDHEFDPPIEVFYDRKEAENEFLNSCTSTILRVSEEYINIGRKIKSMIEVKESETMITMYEYYSPIGGYIFPDKAYRYVLKVLVKGEDY